jgi:hypothetical protein
MNHEEAIELLKGNFGREFMRDVINHTIPICWGSYEGKTWSVHSSGTAFLLNCGLETFLVTAAHVYEGYLSALAETTRVRSFLGIIEFDFRGRLIANLGSKVLDIATFRISQSEISQLGKHVAYGPREWPPAPAQRDDGVLFAGFPGRERSHHQAAVEQTVCFGLYAGLTPVDSSSERHIGCVLERDEWIDSIGNGIPEVGYDLGGASGGPAFLVHESPIGLITRTITGVIYNATAGDMGEIVLIHHVHFINPDGTLCKPA